MNRLRITPADLLVSCSVAGLSVWWWHQYRLGGLVFGVLAGLILLARRHRPFTVLAAVAVLTTAASGVTADGTKLHEGMLLITVAVAMWAVAVHVPSLKRAAAGGLAAVLFASVLGVARPSDGPGWQAIDLADLQLYAGMNLAYAAVLWAAALTVRYLRDRTRSTEREHEQSARLAVASERAEIARELHDIVAHSLSVMILQANGAAYAFDHDPERAREALRTIGATGSDALEEIRQLVELLRGNDGAPDGRTPVALDQIDAVVQRARDAGLTARVTVDGSPPDVPGGVALAVYRIVQESLTNTLKHAGPDPTALVRVSYRPDAIELELTDSGHTAAPGSPGGHGLIGMRERVSLYGGTFEAGPDPAGGWRVHARIPLSGVRAVVA